MYYSGNFQQRPNISWKAGGTTPPPVVIEAFSHFAEKLCVMTSSQIFEERSSSLTFKPMPLFSRPSNPWYLTLAILLLGFVFVKGTQALIGEMTPPIGIISDRVHLWTAPINDYFQWHPTAARIILVTTSLWIDASIVFLSLRALFGPTIRPFLELFFLGLYRQSLQFLVTLPIPEGIIWEYPGFPSLMVDYSLQHDLYFSAHTGVALLVVMELLRTQRRWLSYLGFCFLIYIVAAILCFRIHYTMDVFTGLFVALYIVYTSERPSLAVDCFLQSLDKKLRDCFKA
jgi:hypothetical protein